jgi:hypothetical protein
VRAALAWGAVGLAAATSAAAPDRAAAVIVQKLFGVGLRADPPDAAPSPLDVRQMRFGQRGTQLWLSVRTEGEWDAGDLGADDLCVTLHRARPLGRLCVGADDRGRAVVRYRRARGDGHAPARTVPATVERSDPRSLVARVYPRALRLGFGRLHWVATTRWQGDGCAQPCSDRVPDTGTHRARVSALGGPRCFGAGARVRRSRCSGSPFRRAVIPGPGAAQVTPDMPCRRARSPYDVIEPCRFGDEVSRGRPTVALVGDSHAAHWRAALDVAAKAAGWRAVSLTSPGCSFSTEVYPAPAPIPARCRRHTLEALSWLRRHRSVDTVVTSSSAGRGLSAAGYRAIWSQVPASVRRIHVIRDVPRVGHGTASCVRSVKRRGGVSAGACAVARGGAFPADGAAQAAAGAGGRVRLHDFTRFFCDRSRCDPVIGGAYVYRDFNHMNPVFNSTLGPYLLRALRRAVSARTTPRRPRSPPG